LGRVRLDNLVYSRGLAPSREKARAMIIAGEVWVGSVQSFKPGAQVEESVELRIESRRLKYVSRGGFKLEGAISAFDLNFAGKVVLDVGASTGGYTDCALQNGAVKVFALDVGYGQLDWTLRTDPRVVVMERTNVRYLDRARLGEPVDIITMDVSFISIRLILPVLKDMLVANGEVVSLVKPQFEAGRDQVGKHGVVKDPLVHREVLQRCVDVAAEVGLPCVGVAFSPIKGPKGNIEYFIHLKKMAGLALISRDQLDEAVRRAHSVLGGKE